MHGSVHGTVCMIQCMVQCAWCCAWYSVHGTVHVCVSVSEDNAFINDMLLLGRHCRFNCRKSQPFGRASLRVRRHEATMNHEHGCRLVSATFGIKSLTFNRNKRSVATAKSWRGRFAMHDSTGVWPPTLGTADVHATRLRFQVLHLLDSHHAL